MKQIVDWLRLKHDWRSLVTNYIGSLGYYLIILSSLLWIVGLAMQVSQYIVQPAQGNLSPVGGATEAIAISQTTHPVQLLVLYGLVAGMALLTIVIIVALPYVMGVALSRGLRRLFTMTGQSASVAHLLRYKLLLSLGFMAVVMVTTYQYQLAIEDNWLSFVLLLMNGLAMGLFWLQHIVARYWRLPYRKLL